MDKEKSIEILTELCDKVVDPCLGEFPDTNKILNQLLINADKYLNALETIIKESQLPLKKRKICAVCAKRGYIRELVPDVYGHWLHKDSGAEACSYAVLMEE